MRTATINQYSQRTVPGSFDVIGMVTNGSQTVTVNGTTPYREDAVTQYVWGRDLAGGVDGAGLPGQSQGTAGGVGGLVGIRTGTTTYGVAYDGNGNVMGLVDGSTGTVAARYEYGPFGEVVRATGPMSKINPFRFSTKYQDDETDLVYYGLRFYNASTGRWLNRDPLLEPGHMMVRSDKLPKFLFASLASIDANSYVMVGSDPVDKVDPKGLWVTGAVLKGIEQAAKETMRHCDALSDCELCCKAAFLAAHGAMEAAYAGTAIETVAQGAVTPNAAGSFLFDTVLYLWAMADLSRDYADCMDKCDKKAKKCPLPKILNN